VLSCGRREVARGEELGFFQSGSTIIVFANGPFAFTDRMKSGEIIRVGQPLFRRTDPPKARGA
jgi:phosphatidylserine decarboxylase